MQQPGLILAPDRIGLAQRRDRDDLDPLFGGEQLDGRRDRLGTLAEVRADPDVGTSRADR
jgi:hypothetical protein